MDQILHFYIDFNNYDKMNNHIQINLTLGLEKDYPLVCVYRLVDKESNREYIDNLTIYEFNLEKIKRLCVIIVERKNTRC